MIAVGMYEDERNITVANFRVGSLVYNEDVMPRSTDAMSTLRWGRGQGDG